MQDLSPKVSQSFIEKFNGFTEPYYFYNNEVELRYDPKEHVYYLLKDGQFIPQEGVTSVIHIIDKSNALVPWAAKVVIEKLLRSLPWENAPIGDGAYISLSKERFETIALEAKTAPKDKLEDAAEVGHIAHAWIEQYIKCELGLDYTQDLQKYPDDPRAESCCRAALTWMQKHNVRWKLTERKIYSREYSYAGTMDGLALVDSCDDPLCCPNAFKDRLSVIDWKSSNYLYIEYLIQTAAYMSAYREETGEPVEDRWIIRLGKTDGEFEAWHAEGLEQYYDDFDVFVDTLSLYRGVRDLEDRIKDKKSHIKGEKKRARDAEKEAAKAKARAEKAAAKAEKKAAREQEKAAKKEAKKAKTEADKANN